MTHRFWPILALAILLPAAPAAITSCGRTSGGLNAGAAGSSGGTATGGTATGGTSSVGGIVATGGTSSAGGIVATAGTSSAGGTIATGGTSNAGGAVATGGSGGSQTSPQTTVVQPRVPTAHRPAASSCVGVNNPPEPATITTLPASGSCKSHADCTLGTNGKCVNGIGSAYRYFSCVYDQCGTDADCDPDKVCYCTSNSSARCLSVGNCRIDADCGGGPYSYCSPSTGWDCGGYHTIDSYHCHTPKDSCLDDSDCTGGTYCNFDDYSGAWKCVAPNRTCVIG